MDFRRTVLMYGATERERKGMDWEESHWKELGG